MPTFTPPGNPGEVANSTPRDSRTVQRAMGFFARVGRGRNVWILDGDTVTEEDPVAIYDSNGVCTADSLQRTTRFFQGSATHVVNDAEAALLIAAGYTVDDVEVEPPIEPEPEPQTGFFTIATGGTDVILINAGGDKLRISDA